MYIAQPYQPAYQTDVNSFSGWQYMAWFLLFATSGFVFFEPAPFDLLTLGLFSLFLLLGLRIPNGLHVFLITISLFLGFSLFSSMFASIVTEATKHIMITGFLCVVSLFIASMLATGDQKIMDLLWKGWLVAAVIATFAGVVGFLQVVPGAYDIFTRYGRAMGTFKDPNVFGPFLIPAAMYAFIRFVDGRGVAKLIYLSLVGFLSLGIILSLSRAAMGHLLLSMLIAILAIFMTAERPRERSNVALFLILSAVISVVGISALLNVDSFAQIIGDRLSLSQTYDSGGQGRFDGQAKALSLIMDNPMGIGANEFLHHWPEAPHNVYLTNFLSGGWVAGFSYIALVLVTIGVGVRGAFMRSAYRFHMIIAASSFIGVCLVGFVVDTDHWRQFFMLLGIVWGLYLAQMRAE